MQNFLAIHRQIDRLYRQHRDMVSEMLHDAGITDIKSVQAIVLCNITGPEMTVNGVANGYTGKNVNHSINRLEEYGYIVREKTSGDRRQTIVRLTDKGRALCERITAMHQHRMEVLNLSEEEMEQVARILRRLDSRMPLPL